MGQNDASTVIPIGRAGRRRRASLQLDSETPERTVSEFLPTRSGMLGILFDAASPKTIGGRDRFRPIWAEEAMHRASNMLQFVLLLEHENIDPEQGTMDTEIQCALAKSLAAAYRSLDLLNDAITVPCAEPLRAVVSGLVSLFGNSEGRPILLRMEIARGVSLPAYKRRALVLMASELVVNAIKHAFGPGGGHILLSLERLGVCRARFVIEDSGFGPSSTPPGIGRQVIGGLVGILDADLVYRRSALGGTMVACEFPL